MEKKKSELLEEAKAKLIVRYLALSDQVDAINKQIHELTVEIETINVQIEEAKEGEGRGKA